MRRMLWLVPLSMVGCSCQRVPTGDGRDDVGAASAAVEASASNDDTAVVADLPPRLLSAVDAGAEDPGTVVRAYVANLLRRDRAAIDAAWLVAPQGRRADDGALRELHEVSNLRVNTGVPVARDQLQPTHLIEVPVQVRAMTAAGTQRYTGWYRLAPAPDGHAWLIQSAQVQPVLD